MRTINFKIHIEDIEKKIRFQKILFDLGFEWTKGGKSVCNIYNNNYVIAYNDYYDGYFSTISNHIYLVSRFDLCPFKEITYNEFLKLTDNGFKFGRGITL